MRDRRHGHERRFLRRHVLLRRLVARRRLLSQLPRRHRPAQPAPRASHRAATGQHAAPGTSHRQAAQCPCSSVAADAGSATVGSHARRWRPGPVRRRRARCYAFFAACSATWVAILPAQPIDAAGADALLAQRRPEEARRAYSQLLLSHPGNKALLVGRFYAEIESEDFAAAFATADELGDPVLAEQARHYAGIDTEAWARIAPLAQAAPVPAYIRAAAASIAAARGWGQRAHAELLVAAGEAPNDVGIAVTLAGSLIRRRELDAARAIESRLVASHGAHPAIARLTDDLRIFGSAAFEASVRGRQESGGGASAPGPGYEVTTRVHSAPLASAFRLLAGVDHAAAEPPEGRAERTREGAGIEWRGTNASLEAAGWSNAGDTARSGYALAASWQPSDAWSLAADYERYAWETPLRASLHGITADGGGVGAGYSWSESRAAWIGARAHRFTDGNHRRQVRAAWSERIVERPSFSLTLRPEIYRSSNTRADAPYFNPRDDLSVSLAADVRHILWRRYEQVLRHRVVARAGLYRQEGYPDGWVGGVSYEQAWQRDAWIELRWGIEVGDRKSVG